MLEIVEKLFAKWNDGGVRYVHFKSNEHLAAAVNGDSDFDVFFDRGQQRAIETIYAQLGFKRVYSCEILRYPGVEDWLGFDSPTGKMIHVHHHYHLVTGKPFVKEFELPWGSLALETSGFFHPDFPSIKVADPGFELVLLLVRSVLKRGGARPFSKGERNEMDYLVGLTNADAFASMLKKCFPDMSDSIARKIAGDVIRPEPCKRVPRPLFLAILGMAPAISQSGSILKFRALSAWSKLEYLWKLILKKKLGKWDVFTRKQPSGGGLVLAFVGCDGSGKSTVSGIIAEWLSWKLDAGRVYLGSGDHYRNWYKLLRSCTVKLIRKFRKKQSGLSRSGSSSAENRIKRNPWVVAMENRQHLRVARRAGKILERVNSYRMRGGIAVLDRYPQLQYSGICDGLKIDERFARLSGLERRVLGQAVSIQPDVVFKILIPVEVSLERKPGDDEEIIRRKVQVTRDLAFPRSRVFEIDGTQDFQQEILEIKRSIWQML